MRPRAEQPVVELILRYLEFGPATVNELEGLLRIKRRNLRPYLVLLHAQKRIHISGWEQRTGPALPVWGAGNKKDKPRPPRRYVRRGLLRTPTDEILPLVEQNHQPDADRHPRTQGVDDGEKYGGRKLA